MKYAIFFDIDGTLHKGNFLFQSLPGMKTQKLISEEAVVQLNTLYNQYKNRAISQDKAVTRANTLFSKGLENQPYEKVKQFSDRFVSNCQLYDNVLESFELAKEKEIECVLLSGGPDIFAKSLSYLLAGNPEVYATPIPHNSTHFTGENPETFYTSSEKKRVYDSFEGYVKCGIGDSKGDRGILNERGVLINPREPVNVGHSNIKMVFGNDFGLAYKTALGLLEIEH